MTEQALKELAKREIDLGDFDRCGVILKRINRKMVTHNWRWISKVDVVAEDRVKDVIKLVCQYMGVNEKDLKTKKRNRPLVYTRYLISHILRQKKASLSAIGKVVGRDHSTVLYYCRTVQGYLDVGDEVFSDYINDINKLINDED